MPGVRVKGKDTMAKKKYYFDGRLIRTSDRVYTHVVLRGDKVVSCCGRLELAEKELSRQKNRATADIKFFQGCLKALQDGKASIRYTERVGRRSFTGVYKITEPAEYYQNKIAELESLIRNYRAEPLEIR